MHNDKQINDFVHSFWDESVLPTLIDYIKIPCLSVDFDPDWAATGYLLQAKKLALDWLEQNAIEGWKIYHDDIPDRSPVILIEIPGNLDETILLYGHLDKQPEMEGWWDGFGPWQPILKDDKLYGRGGADDGYALFTSVAAIRAIKEQQLPHARIVVLIEFSEESGSPDLPAYLDKYKQIIGAPDLVITLDSGAGDYQRLWSTTSLRGMLSCVVTVGVLTEATHSGIASGIVPSSMRIMRQLLDRLEDNNTGKLLLEDLTTEIPPQRVQQAQETAQILGDSMLSSFNAVEGLEPVTDDVVELLLNNAWRPTLCVVGQDGIPAVKAAGNVMRAYTTFKLSMRLPPNLDYEVAQKIIEHTLMANPPYHSQVTVKFDQGGTGWSAPALAPWLEQATEEASNRYFGIPAAYFGLGASIPFMAMLGEEFPDAQFLITGVLGPKSNAHGPNEFIHIPYVKKLTACIAYIIARHYELNVEKIE